MGPDLTKTPETAVNKDLQAEFKSVSSKRGGGSHRWIVIALIATAFLLCLPVLINPSWGLFGDPDHILNTGRQFLKDADITRMVFFGGYAGLCRPVFDLYDVLLYRLFGEQSVYFYAANAVIFAATVVFTYFNAFFFCRSRRLSILATSVLLVAASTYEVIYTLDKAEILLGLFISAFLFTFFRQSERIIPQNQDKKDTALSGSHGGKRTVGLLLLFSLLIFLTKQSGHILLLFTLLAPAGLLLFSKPQSHNPQPGLMARLTSPQFKLSLSIFIAAVLMFAVYRMYYQAYNTAADYLTLDLSLPALLKAVSEYFKLIPEYILLLAGTSIITTVAAFRLLFGSATPEAERSKGIYALSLVMTVLAGSVFLLGFRWYLTYLWYPFFTFLIPATAYALASLPRLYPRYAKFLRIGGIAALSGLVIVTAAKTQLQAQFQYTFDNLKDDAVEMVLGQYQPGEKKYVLMPYMSPDASEIGQMLRFLTLDRLQDGVTLPRTWEAFHNTPFFYFNLYAYQPGLPSDSVTSFSQVRKEDIRRLPEFATEPVRLGIYGYTMLHDSIENTTTWHEGPIKPGMYLLYPYGELYGTEIGYRGYGMHAGSLQDQVGRIPTLKQEAVQHVERKVYPLFQKPLTMGWALMRIKNVIPVSLNFNADGTLPERTTLIYSPEAENKRLEVKGFPHQPLELVTVQCAGSAKADSVPVSWHGGNNYTFPLRLNCGPKRTVHLHFRYGTPNNPQNKPLFQITNFDLTAR